MAKGKSGIVSQGRTTIGIKRDTKARLDKNRAPGHCYDGFVYQLIDYWEKRREGAEDYVFGRA